jgi:tripartite ATP-independent transporter DctP family solute receptor
MNLSHKIMALTGLAILICLILFGAAISILGDMQAAANTDASQAALAAGRNTLLMLLIPAVAILLIAGWLIRRAVVSPLGQLQNALSRAADQLDFTGSMVADSGDELGQTAQAYNRLMQQLQKSFAEIQKAAATMQGLTEEVDQSSRKIARNSQIQSDASSNMAAAVEEMTMSIASVAEQTRNAADYTQESHRIADQSAEVILGTISCIQRISESVRGAAERISKLRADCDSISAMARIIREIADQTNLLALNAAIEAARAGEQGRGFAVVADEVRKLAERTAQSTHDITSLLSQMQDSARLAGESMATTEIAVDQGVVSARDAGQSIQLIKDGSTSAADVVEEISGAMREQQTASTVIAQNIEQVAQMSEQNSATAISSAKVVGQMSQASRDIAQLLSNYRIDTAERHIELRMADIHNDEHPAVQAVRRMGELLAERSGGRISLKIYSGGKFGSEKEALEQLQSGALDMTRTMVSQLNKDCPATVVPTLPFLFRSIEHMQHAVDSAPGQEILQSCAAGGYMGLAFFDSGARSIYANKPVRSLADMRGVKLRVPQSDLWIAVAKAMGAQATPMSLDEIIDGQRTGLIEAAENNLPSYEGFKHFEVFKYFSATEHAMAPDILVFSKKRWDSLSADDQALIAQVARETVPLMRRLWKEREDTARRKVQGAGCTIVTDVNKASFESAMKSVYAQFVKTDQQRKLLAAIQNLH